MVPLVMPIATGLAEAKGLDPSAFLNAVLICVSAVLGGAVFGDHASPISDTTILSSTGASCPHLEHVATQMPYAVFVAVCSLIGFFVGGLFMNIGICWLGFAVVMALGFIFLPKLMKTE
jgi:Na+/H+ antiporter NhaC